MHSLIATQIVQRPESSSPSERMTRSFARFIPVMVRPLARAISSMEATVSNGNGNRTSGSPPPPSDRPASSSSVMTKPPPIE